MKGAMHHKPSPAVVYSASFQFDRSDDPCATFRSMKITERKKLGKMRVNFFVNFSFIFPPSNLTQLSHGIQ